MHNLVIILKVWIQIMTFGMSPLSSLLDLPTNIASVSVIFSDQFSIISVKNFEPQIAGNWRKRGSCGNSKIHINPECAVGFLFPHRLPASSVGPLLPNHPILHSHAPLTALRQTGGPWTQGGSIHGEMGWRAAGRWCSWPAVGSGAEEWGECSYHPFLLEDRREGGRAKQGGTGKETISREVPRGHGIDTTWGETYHS